jgi:hypothetical protein
MGMSAYYGPTDEDEGVKTIQRALEMGIDFIDTAQLYGPLTNEILVGRAAGGINAIFCSRDSATRKNRSFGRLLPPIETHTGFQAYKIMPAATVSLVAASMRMKLPVVRFFA